MKKISFYFDKFFIKRNRVNSNECSLDSAIISLAPRALIEREEIEKIQPYLDEVERALAASGITNIALAGDYGSGKSTVIKTFQYHHPEYSYLNISLASFKDNTENRKEVADIVKKVKTKEPDSGINNDLWDSSLERKLEISILQQIFYHVKPSEIPDSRFKRIRNTKKCKLFAYAIGVILWVISVILLFKYHYIDKINPVSWDANERFDWPSLLVLVIFFGGIGFFAKYAVRLFSNSKINKVTIKGELELGNDIDKSVFNEHLEEIIYFFERTKYDVVIIEDLDRFNSTDIFTKLREINLLLNSSKLVKRKHGVNFIYAIRDEMFTDKNDRVKFFDFIIPIIPFINASNAATQLQKLITKRELQDVLSPDFIQDIVTFIDDIDMRLLINIFHEFCIYRKNITVDVEDNLFGIIVYKNMYPNDFGKLSRKEGVLYKLLANKSAYIGELIHQINSQINALEKDIKNINDIKIKNIKELRAIYISALYEKAPDIASLKIDDETIPVIEIQNDDNFAGFKKQKDISYSYYNHYSNTTYQLAEKTSSKLSFADIEKLVDTEFSYDDRERLIIDNQNNDADRLRMEILKLKNKKDDIESWNIKEIFQDIDITPYLGEFTNNQLMRSLLLNGYINENYSHYISLFHEGIITKEDYEFERKVKSGLSLPFDFQLSNIDNLIKKIPGNYFKREVILNFDLLDFLAENISQYSNSYKSIIGVLSNEKGRSTSFIDEYIKREQHIALFVNTLCTSWHGWWDYLYNDRYYDDNKLAVYLKLVIEHAELEDIGLLDQNKNLSKFISISPNLVSLIGDGKQDKFKSVLTKLQTKLDSIEYPNEETRKTFDFIYTNNHYTINVANVSLMLKVYGQNYNENSINTANYTTIQASGCEALVNYIDSNIQEYVKSIFLKLPTNTEEEEKTVVLLLDNSALSNNIKLDIIKKERAIVQNLSAITDREIQQKLIEYNKVLATWNNVFTYFDSLEGGVLDDTLLTFLDAETNYVELSKQPIKEDDQRTEKFITNFSLSILDCNKLSYDSYINLIKATPYRWTRFDFDNLDEDKVKWLVDTKVLSLSLENYKKLKEHFPIQHIVLIEKYQEQLIPKFDEFTFDTDDIHKLLISKEISDKNKVALIQLLDDKIFKTKEISRAACSVLARTAYISLKFDVLTDIMSNSISYADRVKLLNTQSKDLDNSQIKDLIELLGWNYKKIFKKQNKPTFTNTEYHHSLFKDLKNRSLILRYEVNKNNELRVIAKYI